MSSASTTRLNWVVTFAQNNPLLVLWNTVLLFGGLILLAFHASHGFLPDFTLTDIAGLFASVTFIGILLVIFFWIGSFLPAVLLRWIEQEYPVAGSSRYFELPAAKWVLFLFPLLFWVTFFSAVVLLSHYGYELNVNIYLTSAMPCAILMGALLERDEKGTRLKYTFLSKTTWKRGASLFFWTLMIFVPVQIALLLGSEGKIEYGTWVGLGFASMLVLLNTAAYTARPQDLKYLCSVITMLTVFLIPLMSDNPMLFPKTIIQSLSLGNKNVAQLSIPSEQCLNFISYGVKCPSDEKSKTILLENVNLISRVGTTALFELLVSQKPVLNTTQSNQRSYSLNIDQIRRGRYCPGSENSASASCSACDSLLLERAKDGVPQINGNKESGRHTMYRLDLVCVTLAIPKDQISGIVYSGKRNYQGYSQIRYLTD